MFFEVIFNSNKLEDSFSKPNPNRAILVVVLAGLFLALTIFSLTNDLVLSIFSFLTNFINWVVLSGVVFFFWTAHNKKKRGSQSISSKNFFSVVGSLWEINLLAYLVLFSGVVLLTNLYGFAFFDLVGLIFLISLVLIMISWVVSSFRMIQIILKSDSKKTLINWFVLMFLNSLIALLFSRILALFLL